VVIRRRLHKKEASLDASRSRIVAACLRSVDEGESVDAVVRTYPHETDWLRDQLLFSETLRTGAGPSSERRAQARESLLSTLAHSANVSYLPPRPRLAFTIAQLATVTVSFLALTAGAAAAGGVNLRSVPRQVADAIVQPLPLSPQPIHAYSPNQAAQNAAVAAIDTSAGRSPDGGSREDGVEQNITSQPAAQQTSNVAVAPLTDSPADDGPVTPEPRSTPARAEREPTPTPHPSPAHNDPPGQSPNHGGQPSSEGHGGSNGGASNSIDNNNHTLSNRDQTNGPNGNASGGTQGGSSNQTGAEPKASHGGAASKGASK
jgi:hypothetical protein